MTMLTVPTILTLSLLFTRLNHPFIVSANSTITNSYNLRHNSNFYVFLLIFLYFIHIFLGGMLVLFIYIALLASNESFYFSLVTFTLYSLFFGITTLCLLLDPTSTPCFSSLPTSSINTQLSTPLLVSWIYNNTSMIFTLFIIFYLLLTLKDHYVSQTNDNLYT